MEGAVFGSYSLTEFIDLYELNIRNNHHYAVFFEVDADGIIKIKNDKIDNVRKTQTGSYLIGILCPTLDDLVIESTGMTYFESVHQHDVEYLIRTRKEFFFFAYEESKITFTTTKNISIYMSDYGSFSTVEPNGYMVIRPNLTHTIPIFKNSKFITERRELDIKR